MRPKHLRTRQRYEKHQTGVYTTRVGRLDYRACDCMPMFDSWDCVLELLRYAGTAFDHTARENSPVRVIMARYNRAVL